MTIAFIYYDEWATCMFKVDHLEILKKWLFLQGGISYIICCVVIKHWLNTGTAFVSIFSPFFCFVAEFSFLVLGDVLVRVHLNLGTIVVVVCPVVWGHPMPPVSRGRVRRTVNWKIFFSFDAMPRSVLVSFVALMPCLDLFWCTF